MDLDQSRRHRRGEHHATLDTAAVDTARTHRDTGPYGRAIKLTVTRALQAPVRRLRTGDDPLPGSIDASKKSSDVAVDLVGVGLRSGRFCL